MFKKLGLCLFIALGLSLVISLVPKEACAEDNTNLPTSNEIQYIRNKDLNKQQVDQRFGLIASRYKEGESFSIEDAEFIVHYSIQDTRVLNQNPIFRGVYFYKGTVSRSFNKTKTSMGVKVNFYGKISSHINSLSVGGQWYSGKTTAKIKSGSAKVTKIKTVVSQNTYGVIGNSGTYVGLIHKSSLSSTTSKKGATVNYLDSKRKYTAILPVYSYATTYVSVTTTSGTFNLYGI